MFIYASNGMYMVSDCISGQTSGGQCSQCTDCNCVDGD